MPEEIKRKRGRPPKNKTDTNSSNISENNSSSIPSKDYEFNSYFGTVPINDLDSFSVAISTLHLLQKKSEVS